ncbi:beta-alanyl-bioamine nonribosomal peptide synthetase ebony-like [Paramacrobiotus metropolitanus]|uniref:beta-alanyl-bioamine nonribosomal peptide synthetase ebony-like n=1 Tax=Paramacrobiotus metropolitanus TaxID=2943436 RepID=UPI002446557D|nr:beta-alanyl-bioamine nonribosomal peptide synthetase ebony-like [Paramacrobiotus metropolitanus]
MTTSDIQPTSSFAEMGGTSLNAVSTVLKLQESGYTVTVEQFMRNQNLDALLQIVTSADANTNHQHDYVIKNLKENIELIPAAQKLLSDSFMAKCEWYSKCGNMLADDLTTVYEKWWDALVDDSFAVLTQDGTMKAASLAGDLTVIQNLDLTDIHPHFITILDMLQSITTPVLLKYNPQNRQNVVFSKFMLGAATDNTAEENVALFLLMERKLRDLAQEKHYTITLAENVSPLTQQISDYLGCTRCAEIYPCTWEDADGQKPFAACSMDFNVTVDVFELNKLDEKE